MIRSLAVLLSGLLCLAGAKYLIAADKAATENKAGFVFEFLSVGLVVLGGMTTLTGAALTTLVLLH